MVIWMATFTAGSECINVFTYRVVASYCTVNWYSLQETQTAISPMNCNEGYQTQNLSTQAICSTVCLLQISAKVWQIRIA